MLSCADAERAEMHNACFSTLDCMLVKNSRRKIPVLFESVANATVGLKR